MVVLKSVKIEVNGYITFVEVVGKKGEKAELSRVLKAYYGKAEPRKTDKFRVVKETDIKNLGLNGNE